jgi:hypothetical protein
MWAELLMTLGCGLGAFGVGSEELFWWISSTGLSFSVLGEADFCFPRV